MYLVAVHAQVSAAAAPLLDRTLNALVEEVAEEALRCFRQVKKFGMGGMLRVCLLYEVNAPRLTIERPGYARNRVHAPNALALRHAVSGQDARGALQQDLAGLCPEVR